MVMRSTALVVFCGLLAAPAYANPAVSLPSQLVSEIGNEAVLMLSDTTGTSDVRDSEVRRLLRKGFDLAAMGRAVAGGYWDQATEVERSEYLMLFEDYLVRVHARALSHYFGAAIKVDGERVVGADTYVTTSIEQPNAPPVQVFWRVSNRTGSHKILDVNVSGVSMLQTLRAEFMSVIQRGGGKLTSIFASLRQKIAAAN